MTREEAIKEVKNYDNYPNGLSKECRDYIIKTLELETVPREHYEHEFFLRKELDFKVARLEKQIAEQEPCEDAISRQAAQAKIKNICDKYGLGYEDGERKVATGGSAYALGHAFDDMPPVTPTRKKGKWIAKESITGLERFYECSNCGNHCLYKYVEIGFQNAKTKFCPNCGAEMESEDA